MEFVYTFGSAHKALKAESVLKEEGVAFRLMPAPKALAEHCDLVIMVAGPDRAFASAALGRHGVEPRAVYRKENGEYVEV